MKITVFVLSLALTMFVGTYGTYGQGNDPAIPVVGDSTLVNSGIYRPGMEEKYGTIDESKQIEWLRSLEGETDVDVDVEEEEREESGYKRLFHGKRTYGHWGGIGIGYAGFMNNLGDMRLPADASFLSQQLWSPTIVLNFFDYAIVQCKHILLVTGLGMEINNFRFRKDMTLIINDEGITEPYFFGESVSRSKFVTTYINVPLLVEFQFGKKNDFFVNFGGIVGVKISSHTKVRSGNGETIEKLRHHFNVRDFHYGFTANVGCGNWGVFATYYPVSVFREDRGPQVQQGNVGLMFYL